MPINIPDSLPAKHILEQENIFVMTESRATHQDIRPLRIAIFNIMPVKETTETHILRLLSNSPLQITIDLVHPSTHVSKNTSDEHLRQFYKTFDQIKETYYDGFIFTGAPVEHLPFEEVTYWNELTQIFDWTTTHVTSTFFICWGAQAGLYYFHQIPKYPIEQKMFGVFTHGVNTREHAISQGFDELFLAPHSRHTEVRASDIRANKQLEIISESEEAGIYIVASKNGNQIFVTGHSEYDWDTLKQEYERDILKGLAIDVPKNYFPNNDVTKKPLVLWRSHAHLLFTNWLNYYVYQRTPYQFI